MWKARVHAMFQDIVKSRAYDDSQRHIFGDILKLDKKVYFTAKAPVSQA
jgi:hypothetical protein